MEELRIEPADVVDCLTTFIRQAVDNFHREGIIVGLSGGIDSAVVAALAERALGAERVLGLILPERDSAPESKRLARQLARSLVPKIFREKIPRTPANHLFCPAFVV